MIISVLEQQYSVCSFSTWIFTVYFWTCILILLENRWFLYVKWQYTTRTLIRFKYYTLNNENRPRSMCKDLKQVLYWCMGILRLAVYSRLFALSLHSWFKSFRPTFFCFWYDLILRLCKLQVFVKYIFDTVNLLIY